MSLYDEFEKFLNMTPEERKGIMDDVFANTAEPWLGTPDEPLVLAMVGSMRAFMDGAENYGNAREDNGKEASRHVQGLFTHAYTQQARNFHALVALSDMKKSL